MEKIFDDPLSMFAATAEAAPVAEDAEVAEVAPVDELRTPNFSKISSKTSDVRTAKNPVVKHAPVAASAQGAAQTVQPPAFTSAVVKDHEPLREAIDSSNNTLTQIPEPIYHSPVRASTNIPPVVHSIYGSNRVPVIAAQVRNTVESFASTIPAVVTNIYNNPFGGGEEPEKPSSSQVNRDSVEEHGQKIVIPNCDMLSGEQLLISLPNATLLMPGGKQRIGVTLYMTNYRIVCMPATTTLNSLLQLNPSILSWMSVPLACIDKIDKSKHNKDTKHMGFNIILMCKDCRHLNITLIGSLYGADSYGSLGNNSASLHHEKSAADIERAITVIEAYAFPNNIKHLFAFSHSFPPEYPRVLQYDTLSEYSRQGILESTVHGYGGDLSGSMWRLSDINKNFRLCESYPPLLVVPRAMKDQEIMSAASFRSGRRIPTLSWGDGTTGATLWRSSQPKSGVSGQDSNDEKFLTIIAQSCTSKLSPLGVKTRVKNPELLIVDCRARASALANRAAGAGYENTANYPYARLEFFNIGNIHTMRDSIKSLMGLFTGYNTSDTSFSKAVEDTQWLSHVRHVLKAAHDSALSITKCVPVLVHCSHGWDRTAQVCSLAQILLDPYYRTIDGFAILVQKEFLSFGHPLQMRCGHGCDPKTRDEDNVSPIILQFLDCLWQLVNQYPHYFEFNKKYLLTIADHIYSGRFGTFLLNCDADRVSAEYVFHCLAVLL